MDDRLIVKSEAPLVISLFCYCGAADSVKRYGQSGRAVSNNAN